MAQIQPDPILKSWRGYAFAVSVLSLWFQADALWAKAHPMVGDGLSPAEAIEILNQAGPMLATGSEVWGMVLAGVSAALIAISKAREWWKHRRAAQ